MLWKTLNEDFHLLPGVASAVRRINARGWLAIVVSNQPGVAKGKLSMERLVGLFRSRRPAAEALG